MALQTMTILALTQPDTATAKVNFTGTLADADSDTIAIVYEWKLSTDGDWKIATTTGPASLAATPGGVAVAGTWDVDADYSGSLASATLQLRAVTTKAAIKASGSLTAVLANATTGIKDGDTFTVGGETFEFTTDGLAVTGAGNVAVALASATVAVGVVKTAIIDAINASEATVVASSGASNVINLVAKTGGTAGNAAITQVLANATTLTPVGMAGGVNAEVVTGATASLAAASTGTVGEPSTVLVDPNPATNVVNFYALDQLGKYGKGSIPQAAFKNSIVYKALDMIRKGVSAKFDIEANRAGTSIALGLGANHSERRAVLISVAEFNRVRGSAQITAELKSKQWLSHTAWRSLTSDGIFGADGSKVYGVYESVIVKGQVQHTIVAYLVSGVKYASLAN